MESKWLATLLVALLILGVGWSEGCLEEERFALLRLKPFFNFIDDIDIGSSVDVIETASDCCKWERVECNPTTGRVIRLFLENTNNLYYTKSDWYLNASLFFPFEELQSLSLGENSIAGFVRNQGFERLSSKLNKLEVLDLSFNYFNGSIFASLSELSSLKSLDLSGNLFTGSNSSDGIMMLSKLNNLKTLNLSHNNLGNNLLSQLGGFTSLKSLHLKNCALQGTVDMLEFNTLINLKELNLAENGIESLGSSFRELKLRNLEVLELRMNPLNNTILSSLGQLSSLKSLSFGGPQLKGSLDLDGLSNLEELSLVCYSDSNCSLPLEALGLFSSLKTLSLRDFSITETTASHSRISSVGSLGEFSSLKHLELFSCDINRNLTLLDSNHLKNLESLDILYTSLASNFLHKLGAMPRIKILRLLTCGLDGTLHTQGFCGLTNLRELVLTHNNLNSSLPACFSNFTSLESLDLSFNQIWGDVSVLKTLTSLKSLGLSSNNLSGDVSTFKSLSSLKSLDLSSNQLSGDVSTFKSLSSLEILDISSNQFSGNVSTFKSLKSLKELDLSNNYFKIPSSLRPFFNLSRLEHFRADNSIIYVETEMQSLVPRFQLNGISLSCCGDAGQFPQFLYHQRHLWYVDLSNVNLKGEFPDWLLKNNSNLYHLYLANNSLLGPLDLSFPPRTALFALDISKNFFYGNVPIEIGAKLPFLRLLNMSKNHFHGSIPSSIGDMNYLGSLDLSDNQLSGGLPEHLTTDLSFFYSLTLSNNKLQGQMFSSNFSLTYLRELHLDGNHFSGKISDSLSNCSFLSTLDLSNNELSGEIPRWMENMSSLSTLDLSNNTLSGEIPKWMGNMSSLEEIVMANNHLEGPFPVEFCHLNLNLKLLDLSANNISGHLPSCFSPLWISQVHLSRNKLEGSVTNAFRNSTILVTLDLSNNHFTGKIPDWIGNLSQLSYLLLNNNHFEGVIPVRLCNLGHLSLIDLSNNNLSGTIPPCLKITTLNEISEEYVRYVADVAQAPSSFSIDEPIQFTSKNMSYSYKGRLLTYLSGIDLSCNKLTGEIPRDVKNFRNIYALNLSHNSLVGPIPATFSDLKQIESLDLSHNNLSGKIPPQLVGLYSLSYFRVGYNNLSGSTPVWVAQFATFDQVSYVGNPFLCGKPLPKNCSTSRQSPSLLPKASTDTDDGLIDMSVFYVTFVVSYAVVILSIACVLYINPYWRRAWFYHIGTISNRCYYFLEDHILPKRFNNM